MKHINKILLSLIAISSIKAKNVVSAETIAQIATNDFFTQKGTVENANAVIFAEGSNVFAIGADFSIKAPSGTTISDINNLTAEEKSKILTGEYLKDTQILQHISYQALNTTKPVDFINNTASAFSEEEALAVVKKAGINKDSISSLTNSFKSDSGKIDKLEFRHFVQSIAPAYVNKTDLSTEGVQEALYELQRLAATNDAIKETLLGSSSLEDLIDAKANLSNANIKKMGMEHITPIIDNFTSLRTEIYNINLVAPNLTKEEFSQKYKKMIESLWVSAYSLKEVEENFKAIEMLSDTLTNAHIAEKLHGNDDELIELVKANYNDDDNVQSVKGLLKNIYLKDISLLPSDNDFNNIETFLNLDKSEFKNDSDILDASTYENFKAGVSDIIISTKSLTENLINHYNNSVKLFFKESSQKATDFSISNLSIMSTFIDDNTGSIDDKNAKQKADAYFDILFKEKADLNYDDISNLIALRSELQGTSLDILNQAYNASQESKYEDARKFAFQAGVNADSVADNELKNNLEVAVKDLAMEYISTALANLEEEFSVLELGLKARSEIFQSIFNEFEAEVESNDQFNDFKTNLLTDVKIDIKDTSGILSTLASLFKIDEFSKARLDEYFENRKIISVISKSLLEMSENVADETDSISSATNSNIGAFQGFQKTFIDNNIREIRSVLSHFNFGMVDDGDIEKAQELYKLETTVNNMLNSIESFNLTNENPYLREIFFSDDLNTAMAELNSAADNAITNNIAELKSLNIEIDKADIKYKNELEKFIGSKSIDSDTQEKIENIFTTLGTYSKSNEYSAFIYDVMSKLG